MTRGRCALSTFCSLGTPPSTQMRLQACQYHHRYAYSTVTSVNGGSTFAWRRSTLDLCRGGQRSLAKGTCIHPGGNPGANLESISPRCHPILMACTWELTEETLDLPLGASSVVIKKAPTSTMIKIVSASACLRLVHSFPAQ